MTAPTKRYGIVVGVDGSPTSNYAVCWAARDAAMRHVPLTLVHMLHPFVPAAQESRDEAELADVLACTPAPAPIARTAAASTALMARYFRSSDRIGLIAVYLPCGARPWAGRGFARGPCGPRR